MPLFMYLDLCRNKKASQEFKNSGEALIQYSTGNYHHPLHTRFSLRGNAKSNKHIKNDALIVKSINIEIILFRLEVTDRPYIHAPSCDRYLLLAQEHAPKEVFPYEPTWSKIPHLSFSFPPPKFLAPR